MSRGMNFNHSDSNVFHNLSYNLPLLSTWIDEMVQLTQTSLPDGQVVPTIELVNSLKRYDVCFKELLRQTTLYSEDLTKLYAKLWIGVLKLMDGIIKVYHRYVVNTEHIQEQAKDLIHERQAQMAATKISQEENELEKTSLRAKIRNLEGELDSVSLINREYERENRQLRILVETYIDARDFDQFALTPTAEKKPAKKSNSEAGSLHLKQLNALDIQMNDTFNNILREEDRQQALLTQLTNLMNKHDEILKNSVQKHNKDTQKINYSDAAIQIDQKDAFGLVDEPFEVVCDDNPLEEPPELTTVTLPGSHIPYQIRRHLKEFPHVLRIPSEEWVGHTILSIYLNKCRNDSAYDHHIFPLEKKALPDYLYSYFTDQFRNQTLANMQIIQFLRGCELHAPTNKRVLLFAQQLGLFQVEEDPPLAMHDTDIILMIIRKLQEYGELRPDEGRLVVQNSHSIGNSDNQMGFEIDIKRTSAISIASMLFEKWLSDGGSEYFEKVKSMPGTNQGNAFVNLDDFIELSMEQWSLIKSIWEEHLNFLFNMHSSVFQVISEVRFQNDSGRKDKDVQLIHIAQKDSVHGSFRPLRSITGLERPAQPPQQQIPSTQHEFSRQVTRMDSMPTPTPSLNYTHDKKALSMAEELQLQLQIANNAQKDSFCKLLTKRSFQSLFKVVCPNLTPNEINTLYEAAREISAANIQRALDKIWIRCIREEDQRPYYFNKVAKMTQWTRPYHAHTFSTIDLEQKDFTTLMLRYRVFNLCPLIEYFHLNPEDLWTNTQGFYKELEATRRKAVNKAKTHKKIQNEA